MLVLTLRERDGGVEIETKQGDVLRLQIVEIRGGSVRVGFDADRECFDIAREKAIVRFPKQPGDDGPKAA